MNKGGAPDRRENKRRKVKEDGPLLKRKSGAEGHTRGDLNELKNLAENRIMRQNTSRGKIRLGGEKRKLAEDYLHN